MLETIAALIGIATGSVELSHSIPRPKVGEVPPYTANGQPNPEWLDGCYKAFKSFDGTTWTDEHGRKHYCRLRYER